MRLLFGDILSGAGLSALIASLIYTSPIRSYLFINEIASNKEVCTMASKQKFKEFGLLNTPGEPTPVMPVKKKEGLLNQISKELSNDDMQAMAKNSKKWADEDFYK